MHSAHNIYDPGHVASTGWVFTSNGNVLGLGEDDGIVQPLIIGNFTDEPTVVLEQVKDFSVSPRLTQSLQ